MRQKYKVTKRTGGRVQVEVLIADSPSAPFVSVGQLKLTESQWAAFKNNLPAQSAVEEAP